MGLWVQYIIKMTQMREEEIRRLLLANQELSTGVDEETVLAEAKRNPSKYKHVMAYDQNAQKCLNPEEVEFYHPNEKL